MVFIVPPIKEYSRDYANIAIRQLQPHRLFRRHNKYKKNDDYIKTKTGNHIQINSGKIITESWLT